MRIRPFLLSLGLVGAGCASVPKPFETPQGQVSSQQFALFDVIGVSHLSATSLNQGNGYGVFEETVKIEVPVGTELIVPSIRGWRLNYGAIQPNTAEVHVGLRPASKVDLRDHHYGWGSVNVFVQDIDAPNTSTNPPKQTATLLIQLWLRDKDGKDGWSGQINYSLIFLRKRLG